MRKSGIDKTTKIYNSVIDKNVEIREYSTIHDSKIGNNCRVYERVSIKRSKIGKRVDINANSYIEFADIEDDVQIGPNCSIVGVFHKFSKSGAERKDSFKKIIIGRGSFIGAGSIVLPGRKIGKGSIVGAGATITENIQAYHIAIGVPPKQINESLKEWIRKKKSGLMQKGRIEK